MIKIFFCIVGFLAATESISQPSFPAIGSDFDFRQQITMDGKRVDLMKYFGKPLIIDLFTAGCGVCFNSFPKLNLWSQKLNGEVNLIILGNDDIKLPKIYERFSARFKLQLNVGYDSFLFKKIAPPSVPFYVWIDSKGKVAGVSGIDLVNESTLQKFSLGDVSFLSKKQKSRTFKNQYLLPEFTNTTVNFCSMVTAPVDSFGVLLPQELSINRYTPFFQVINATVDQLYKYAWFGKSYWLSSDSLYGSTWKAVYVDGDSLELDFLKKQACYSLKMPGQPTSQQMRDIMQRDLVNAFGRQARIEVRMLPYWAIRMKAGTNGPKRSQAKVQSRRFSYAGIKYHRVPIAELVKILEQTCGGLRPFIDESGISYEIDLVLDVMMNNLDDVRSALEKVGIELVEKTKPMHVLVIERTKNSVAAISSPQH